MKKEELEKYAHENRKRLDAQEVKIGDVVKVLRGQFAGETGVVVGIIACIGDYTDPYYEVDMDCEVPDKYKCRKNTLAQPNNVIGGLSAYDFEVIGNRAPMQSTEEIKVGDKVRVSKDAPRIYTPDWVDEMFNLVLKVTKVEDGNAMVVFAERTSYKTVLTAIPTKYLIKVNAEAKEPKFKVGEIVRYRYDGKLYIVECKTGKYYYTLRQVGGDIMMHDVLESDLELVTEPKQEIKAGDMIDTPKGKGKVTMVADGYVLAQGDNGEWWQMITFPIDKDKEFEDNIRNVLNGTDEFPMGGHISTSIIQTGEMDWDAYTADLAKEIVLKVANKYNDPTEAADYAVSVAKAVVENLKKK